MATVGYFLYQGDKTTCGGMIISGASDDTYMGRKRVRKNDEVTCAKHSGIYKVVGGMGDIYHVGGIPTQFAGTIESFSSCPCRAKFIPSVFVDIYQ